MIDAGDTLFLMPSSVPMTDSVESRRRFCNRLATAAVVSVIGQILCLAVPGESKSEQVASLTLGIGNYGRCILP